MAVGPPLVCTWTADYLDFVRLKLSIRYTPTKPSQLFARSKYSSFSFLFLLPFLISDTTRDATGFSRDVCGILSLLTLFILKSFLMPVRQADSQYHKMLLLAGVCVINSQVKSIIKAACISRDRFEIALLIQSIFMILAQVRILVHV
jgi:hypothetical protein